MTRTTATIIAALAIVLAGCGSAGESSAAAPAETITVTASPVPAETVTVPAPAETVTVEPEPVPAETVTVEGPAEAPDACADIQNAASELESVYRDRIIQIAGQMQAAAEGSVDLGQVSADADAFVAEQEAAAVGLAVIVLGCEPDQN